MTATIPDRIETTGIFDYKIINGEPIVLELTIQTTGNTQAIVWEKVRYPEGTFPLIKGAIDAVRAIGPIVELERNMLSENEVKEFVEYVFENLKRKYGDDVISYNIEPEEDLYAFESSASSKNVRIPVRIIVKDGVNWQTIDDTLMDLQFKYDYPKLSFQKKVKIMFNLSLTD